MLLEILFLCLIIQVNTRLFSKNEAITILSSLEQTSSPATNFSKNFPPRTFLVIQKSGSKCVVSSVFFVSTEKRILTLWMPRAYIYVLQWSSPWPQMFFTNNHGRIYTSVGCSYYKYLVAVYVTSEVYIRPWLLMPKQRGIQRVNLLIHPIIHSFCQEKNRMFLFMS